MIVQGVEAGGHRGGFDDAAPGEFGLLALLQLVRARVGDALPLVATGGLATGRAVAGVLAGGATAAQLGTAFMLCPEAATAPAHRDAIADSGAQTALTRAFTGRSARGILNRFQREHSADAPARTPRSTTSPRRCAPRRASAATPTASTSGPAKPTTSPNRFPPLSSSRGSPRTLERHSPPPAGVWTAPFEDAERLEALSPARDHHPLLCARPACAQRQLHCDSAGDDHRSLAAPGSPGASPASLSAIWWRELMSSLR